MELSKNFKVGKLILTGNIKRSNHNKFYECKCECGVIKYHTKQNILKGTLKSCGCFKKNTRGKNHKNWKGIGEISSSFYCRWKSLAHRRQKKFNISLQYISDLFEKQKKSCAISGEPLTTPLSWEESHTYNYTASLDRIDSSKDYIEGNVQWVHKDVNMMKQQFSQGYFIELCKKIANKN